MDKALLNRMQGLCSKKEYCVKQILEKLTKAGCSEDGASEIVASLCKDKYIDEQRYARAYVRDKAILSGWGDAKIRYALHLQGIGEENIARAFDELEGQEREKKILKVLEGKLKMLKDSPESRLKLIKFALSRGFSYEQVNPLICRLLDKKADN